MSLRRKVIKSVYFTLGQDAALKRLSERTRIKAATYVREAIDDLLKKYNEPADDELDGDDDDGGPK